MDLADASLHWLALMSHGLPPHLPPSIRVIIASTDCLVERAWENFLATGAPLDTDWRGVLRM